MKFDAIIIDSLVSYQNIAFDFGIVNLRFDDEVMTLPNLIKHYYPEKSEAFANRTVNLEECGKLNGIYLYDYLKKSGFKCAIVSNVLEDRAHLEYLLAEGAHAVIISTTWIFGSSEVKKATQLVRECDSKVPIIVGGVLIFNSYLIYQQRNNDDFDHRSTENLFFFINDNPELIKDIDIFIVDRSGVKTLTKVLNAIKGKEDYHRYDNTAYYRNDNLIINSQQPEKIDLNNQIISWRTLDSEYIPDVFPVQLSLGCNFGCKFCNFFHKRHCYTKSKENIRKELNWIRSSTEVKMIRFVDDSMPAKVMHDLCEIMLEEQFGIPWTTFVRLDAITKENVDMLKNANCVDIQVGIESGDDRILENMGKKVTADRYLRILDQLSYFDISIRSSFIIGYPGENHESIENTIAFINELPTDRKATFYVGFAPFILLPLAPIYYESARSPFHLKGYLIDWSHESMSFADIPNYLKKIFLSVKSDVIFAYTGDPMDLNISKNISHMVKLARQEYQKGIVQGLPEKEIDVMRTKLINALDKLQESIF